jgi:hypothetical protein
MPISRRSKLIRDCILLADQLSAANGFVTVRSIAQQFSVSVVFRPLLVEAMLASIPASDSKRPQWLVLVDSDRYPSGQTFYENESADQPLPGRLRNTIVHEILHSLSFREGEADFEFRVEKLSRETREEYIKRVECETEELSPLLLIPEKCLQRFNDGPPVTLSDLMAFQSNCAVSKQLLVNRLSFWKRLNETGGSLGGGLENISLGIGTWEGRNACISKTNVFSNFRKGYLPDFFRRLQSESKMRLNELVGDQDFIFNGGEKTEVEIDGHQGGEARDYLRMRIRVTVEPITSNTKRRFWILVEKLEGPRLLLNANTARNVFPGNAVPDCTSENPADTALAAI